VTSDHQNAHATGEPGSGGSSPTVTSADGRTSKIAAVRRGRSSLRDFFEVDARFITLATLHELFLEGKIERSVIDKAITDLGINPEKLNPVIS